jgi:MFS transporter, DHA1 family, multidrug resistance protein
VLLGWHAVFWFLVAVGLALCLANWRLLPETLHISQRQPVAVGPLLRGYAGLLRQPRFLALTLASGVPFNGFFLYVLASPEWLGRHLALGPTQFFWFFLSTVSGVMAGAWWSGRLAGQFPPRRQVRRGFRIMVAATLLNLVVVSWLPAHAAWAIPPVSLYAFGWSLMVPVVTLMLLDLAPERRGMASSLHACISSVANGLVAGLLVPLVMHSPLALAVAMALLMSVGLVAWWWVSRTLR